MPSFNQITVSQLSRLIGTPKAPRIIDVCIDEDFTADPRLIPTAIRHPHSDIESLVTQLTSEHVVIVCQKGLKLSQGAAAILRAYGIRAEILAGGNFAWRDAGEPLIPVVKLPQLDQQMPTLWVTKQRPKVDKIACAWLIRRFIDNAAKFLFVSRSEVLSVADKYNAIPFDVEDVYWGHRNNKCTFDTMIEELCLETEVLKKLALIVRGADTDNVDLTKQSAGLLSISLGLSRLHSNDIEQLEAGLSIYDALYYWLRDASHEVHTHESQLCRDN